MDRFGLTWDTAAKERAESRMNLSAPLITVEELVDRVSNLRVYWRSGRPALYQPITLLWAIGRARRGEKRLISWPETERALRDLLERYASHGERGRVAYPVAALHTAGLWEIAGQHGPVPTAHGHPRRWFEEQQPTSGLSESAYILMGRSGFARIAVVNAILSSFFQDVDPLELLREIGLSEDEMAEELNDSEDPVLAGTTPQARYQRLCGLVEQQETAGLGRRGPRTISEPIRSTAARGAVLVRSRGHCENPACGGQPADVTDRGAPILEVDHVEDLAPGGRDHPEQMVALCPNCHAIKTRGRSRERLRKVLLQIAHDRHADWMRMVGQ